MKREKDEMGKDRQRKGKWMERKMRWEKTDEERENGWREG